MNDALKIMDLLEAGYNVHDIIHEDDWKALRKAIEAQSDRTAHQDQKHTECAENLVKAREELAQARARIARLEQLLEDTFHREADAVGWPSAFKRDIYRAINESDRQSLVAVKAEAMREYAAHKRQEAVEAGQGARRDRCNRMASNAKAYADRLEHEAKES